MTTNFEQLQSKVYGWAEEKNLLHKINTSKQFEKVLEEVEEIREAIKKGDKIDLKDGIGDTIVTLIILAYQNDLHPVDCLNHAWNEIKDRKGKTINGTFIKDNS